MNRGWKGLTAAAFLSVAGISSAAETGLLGIKLFDTGVRVVSIYGSPDSIEAVNIGTMGGGAGGPGGAPGGPPGGPSFGGPGRPGGGGPSMGGGGAAGAPSSMSFGDYVLRQGAPTLGAPAPQGSSAAPGGPSGFPGGMPGGVPGGFPGGGTGARPPSGGGGAATNATFTRWVYNRSGSKYGFVIDNKGRVIQIEAIGISNPRVKTAGGITFGDTFAEVIKKYQTPDGYDISGNNVMARFLNKSKVAFRFTRLADNKPQVVTGIVVAAGKG